MQADRRIGREEEMEKKRERRKEERSHILSVNMSTSLSV